MPAKKPAKKFKNKPLKLSPFQAFIVVSPAIILFGLVLLALMYAFYVNFNGR